MHSLDICPLCQFSAKVFSSDKKRSYFQCKNCRLIFVPQKDHLSKEKELEEYNHHENNPNDPGYRTFLSQVITPLKKYVKPQMEGLDFGSGPGPTLHTMLEEEGFAMEIYDPFYANDRKKLEKQYDFVTCTEVVEHFNNPNKSWTLLTSLVKKGGYLAIMTYVYDPKVDFSSWWYKNNDTHIAFYSKKTLEWIAKHFSMEILYANDRVALFKSL